jgi:hypothetical protein
MKEIEELSVIVSKGVKLTIIIGSSVNTHTPLVARNIVIH